MRFFRREVWSYAVLLITLFSIASLAARAIIVYLEELIPPNETRVATALIWVLTLGFMFIAGAFGLWAIKFSAEAESRRRISRFVDAMDYISDGLVAVDFKGHVTGVNPAAARLLGTTAEESASLRELFPSLSAGDVSGLVNTEEPFEVERTTTRGNELQVLRFRSQPSEDVIIILVSDVTRMNSQRLHSRQMARLQLIGQLARGVAHDLNNLFSGISGHAAILPRLRPGSPDLAGSVDAIQQASEQGISLAGHLMELAQPGTVRTHTDSAGEHVRNAVSMLRDSLQAGWRIEESIGEHLPSVPITGIQLEQMILNLGILAADAVGTPGIMRVALATPSQNALFNVGDQFAAVALITAGGNDSMSVDSAPAADARGISRESGIILSVIQSMVEEAGGAFYSFAGTDRTVIYRVSFPRCAIGQKEEPGKELADDVKAFVSSWTVLFACPGREYASLDRRLTDLGIRMVKVDGVIAALARIEDDRHLDAMILDKYMLGKESKGLLRAILKLHPQAGIVVLCDDPDTETDGLSSDVVFVQNWSAPDKVVSALVSARTLAVRRKAAHKSPLA